MKADRLNLEDWALGIAQSLAERSTCARRKAGAVALNTYNQVVGTGYNGQPRGWIPHCINVSCPGVAEVKGTTDLCEAVHAEINMIINSPSPNDITHVFLTASPCWKCALALANLPCLKRVIYLETYTDTRGITVLRRSGIRVFKHQVEHLDGLSK